MSLLHVLVLALVQGLAELLPVSSSAHVVVVEKLMGLDPSSPQMTLLLVILHTGTMFSVIVYFWETWKQAYFRSRIQFQAFLIRACWAMLLTAVVGYPIIAVIERTLLKSVPKAEIEALFSRLDLVGPALLAGGVLIVIAGLKEAKAPAPSRASGEENGVTLRQAGWIGAIQGLCLPFRGFSRSGATISTGLLAGTAREAAERFSFAWPFS